MDYEGNGRPCLYQVITGGDQGEILKKDGKPSSSRSTRFRSRHGRRFRSRIGSLAGRLPIW
jgi:hypothetical protein